MESKAKVATSSSSLQFFVNGKLITDSSPDPNQLLVGYIRDKLGLTGTKVGCGVGGCGACTVIISKFNSQRNDFSHCAINSCITPLCAVHGCHVLTIEGLANEPKTCHFIQDALGRGNGSQCGFCSPGMVLSFHDLLHSNATPNARDIKKALRGNLCRCTGYRPILEAFQNCRQEKCAKINGVNGSVQIEDLPNCVVSRIEDRRKVLSEPAVTFEEIERLLSSHRMSGGNLFEHNESVWMSPDSLQALIRALEQFPNAQLIAGATQAVFSDDSQKISIAMVPELRTVQHTEDGISFGSMVTISEMVKHLTDMTKKLAVSSSSIFTVIVNLMEQSGNAKIRNSATLGGSLATSNKASDFQTVFTAFGMTADVLDRNDPNSGPKRVKELPSSKKSVILKINIPKSNENEHGWAYKLSKTDDGAVLNMAILATMDTSLPTQTEFAKNLSVAVGGKAVKRFQLKIDVGNEQSHAELIHAKILEGIDSNLVRDGEYSSEYVRQLGKSFCIRFCDWLAEGKKVDESNQSTPPLLKATRLFSRTDDGDYSSNDLVGKPQPHESAYKHATGEAQYVDDVPKYARELALAFVVSGRAHAYIKRVDVEQAMAVEGVVGLVSHKDLSSFPGQNSFGLVVQDEEVFASKKVVCVGQIILGVVASTAEAARKAAGLVQVEYKDIQPRILSIPDAIKHDSFYHSFSLLIETGNCSEAFRSADHLIEEEGIEVGGQEHFYMEPQGSVAIPNGEDGEMTIISATQHPTEMQHEVARRLGIPANRITVKVKRVGGGFGGKQTRSFIVAIPVAVAAQKFGRPVRAILDRKTDVLITGKRPRYQFNYQVAFKEGKITALDCSLYCDAGCSLDMSGIAMERALTNFENGNFIPNVRVQGHVCKTNLPSNTAFRALDGPQSALIMETIVERVAQKLKKDHTEIRRLNMYKEGDVTPYGQKLTSSTVRRCWDECIRLSNYEKQKSEVEEFNSIVQARQSGSVSASAYRKRGIALTPVHYGIAITNVPFNQAGALVNIYKDGSVVVNHGGVELGQGLHTKMIQVASRELKIDGSKIRVVETSTDKIPNSSVTGASISSDINGMAVMFACQELRKRLQVYFDGKPDLTWENAVTKAFMDRVSLSATGFYKTPNLDWGAVKRGSPFNYFCSGTACTVIELDSLTGKHQILKTDIVMDVGNSLNPAIDVGQIEGAFMQGVGMLTTEELKYDTTGKLVASGPTTYKIPCIEDIPFEFNVSLLSNSPNPRAIYSSKAVGEPPLLLASSVFFAIKNAIEAERKSKGLAAEFELTAPATVDKILLACTRP